MILKISVLVLLCGNAFAQEDFPEELPAITVTSQKESIEATVFPDKDLNETPVSATLIKNEDLQKHRIQRLADVTRLEASTTDSYNSVGYWDYLAVRGYILDNRGSYLREGLPINAETSIPLDNKERIEILKGLNGIQVGSSSPGGMVNYVVKRPSKDAPSEVSSSVSSHGNFLLSGSAGGHLQFAYENLNPAIDHSQGSRYMISLAHTWSLSENILLEAEIEHSRRSQPSQASLSLLGDTVPSVQDPRLNLNNQPWSQPVVFSALTGSVRFTQSLSSQWKWSAIVGVQDLNTDDHLAYPYGCSSENRYDRFCSDGTFDVYDFRSENERRLQESAKISTQWTTYFGEVTHNFNMGAVQSNSRERFQKQAYNFVGVGSIQGTVLPEDPSLTDESTNRDSKTTELFLYDAIQWKSWSAWVGLRRSDIDRYSIRTDGSRATGYREDFVVPWAALSYQFEKFLAYGSYGEGIETFVTPNKSGYANPGVFIPVARSRQYELGLKGQGTVVWSAALFEIHRPLVADESPLYQIDGEALHRGLELQAQTQKGSWTWGGSAMILEARREQSTLRADLNGKNPVNVPKNTLRAFTEYQDVKKVTYLLRFSREDERAITADNSLTLPAWTNWDLGAAYTFTRNESKTKISLLLENILDEKYWRESPTQYAHIYLYPGMERTLSLNLQHTF